LQKSLQETRQQPRFHYLVLDCDGVLVDTEAASCEALRRAILQITGAAQLRSALQQH
jgi:beta-phosphoglucomutase-like phosphatase (HAD superfamily)